MIPTEAWQILTKYFENSAVAVPQFYFAAETCSQCEAQKFDQFAKADQLKSAASSWKTDLHELIAKKNRPNWANQDEIYLLCEKFHTKVVDFVK